MKNLFSLLLLVSVSSIASASAGSSTWFRCTDNGEEITFSVPDMTGISHVEQNGNEYTAVLGELRGPYCVFQTLEIVESGYTFKPIDPIPGDGNEIFFMRDRPVGNTFRMSITAKPDYHFYYGAVVDCEIETKVSSR